jgi:hypothetical protein
MPVIAAYPVSFLLTSCRSVATVVGQADWLHSNALYPRAFEHTVTLHM